MTYNENIIDQKLSNLTNSLRLAIKQENWYAALTVSLSLPDICGKLEYPNDGSYKRYKKWFDEYMLPRYSIEILGEKIIFLTGNDAYSLRCSYLHGGEADIKEQRKREVLDEFVFMPPKKSVSGYSGSHNIKINSRLVLRVDKFCEDICNSVDEWIAKNKHNERIKKSVSKMLTIADVSLQFDGVYIE